MVKALKDDVPYNDKTKKQAILTGKLTYAEAYPKLVGLQGWLAWLVVGIGISVCYNLFQSLNGFFDSSNSFSAEVLNVYPNLPLLIGFENIMQLAFALLGIYLLVKIGKKEKLAVRIAVVYFILIFIYTLVDLGFANAMFSGNQAALDAISKETNSSSRSILFSILWLLYFLNSKRVKATFTRDNNLDAMDNQNIKELPMSVTTKDESKLGPDHFKKQLSNLENIAIKLDKNCRDGEVATDNLDKAQSYLNSVADRLTDSKSVGNNAYIIYEVQSLIHWARDEEQDSRELAKCAAKVKGDNVLFTQTANRILRT